VEADVKIQDSFSVLSEVKGDVFPVPISGVHSLA
jgi:hypothetical protein